MNMADNVSLKEFRKEFKKYVHEDLLWKEQMTKDVKPLLKARADAEVIKGFYTTVFHIVATVFGAVLTLGMILHYIIGPIFNKKL